MIKKSIFAALLIAFSMFVLAAAPAPIGTFLFAFGLMGICYCDGYLYTGKCGYAIENKSYIQTLQILLINLIAGWIFGFIISYIYPYAYVFGQQRILTQTNPLIYFIQSIGCGVIMFLAVDIKKKYNTPLGIIYGIPLFIFCGLQHSIANIIACGMAQSLNPIHLLYVLLAALGNWIGSIVTWYLTKS